MADLKVINVNIGVYDKNNTIAEEIRVRNKMNRTFLANIMASPGAGKTSVLLRTIEALRNDYSIGVMEADIDATVDAEKMRSAGVRSIQVHTGGECAMNANMTKEALDEFSADDLDIIFLENVGNLVCPAEEESTSRSSRSRKAMTSRSSTRSCSKCASVCSSTRSTRVHTLPSTMRPS